MKRAPYLLLLPILATSLAVADDMDLPGSGFDAKHYEVLWTKSPFAVATAEAATAQASDYLLVGVAQFDGVSYASLIDKQSQEHFLLASDKPVRGLSLSSITRGANATAVVQRGGETLTLKLEQNPVALGGGAPPPMGGPNMQPAPGIMPAPGANPQPFVLNGGNQIGAAPGSQPPRIIIRRHPIMVPPIPGGSAAPAAAPTSAPAPSSPPPASSSSPASSSTAAPSTYVPSGVTVTPPLNAKE